MTLGATDSRPTTRRRETLGLSADGIFTHLWLLLPPGSTLGHGSQGLTVLLFPMPHAPLPDYPRYLGVLPGLGGGLKPRPFSGPLPSSNKLLRTYCRIAVSELTFLMSQGNDAILIHTEPTLWGLNRGARYSALEGHAYRGQSVSRGLR